jgi:hypothetical protein
MENIEKYIKCCGRLGLNSVNLFNTIDLYEGKDMGVVLNNLHVLSQQIAKNDIATLATLLNTLSVPVVKEPTTTSQTNSFKLGRRSTHIESPPGGSPVLGSSPTTALFNPFQATSKPPAHVATLQDDLFVKEEMKYNPELERQAKNWIEALLDVTFPADESLISLLKPGVILCKIMNAIEAMGCKNVTVPTFPKIYDGGIAYKQMENIEQYKQACEKLGLKQTDLFVTSDLFEEKNINNVITHIHFFAKFVQKWEGYTGPIMEDSSKVRNLFSETLVVADAPEARLQRNTSVVVQILTPEQQELVSWVNMKLSRPHSRRLGSLVAFSNVKTPPQSPSNLRHSSSNSDIHDAPISRITNLGSDFRSGVVLIRLLEIVTKLSVGAYEKEPRIVWHFMVNASLALRFLSTQACCKVVCCSSQDIVMGREDKITALISFIRDRYDLEYLFMKELKKDGDVQFDDNELRTFGFKQLGNRGSARDDGKKHKKRHHRSGSSGSSSSISRHKRSSSTAAVPAESSRKDKKSKKEKKRKRGSSIMTPVVTEHDETSESSFPFSLFFYHTHSVF